MASRTRIDRTDEPERAALRSYVMDLKRRRRLHLVELPPEQIESCASGDVHPAIDHPAYGEEIELFPGSTDELLRDPRPDPSEKG
jgi:hypothetical protein